MATSHHHWTELVEKSLFEQDSTFRQHRLEEAMRATEDRLFDIRVEIRMLLEARRKLRTANEKARVGLLCQR